MSLALDRPALAIDRDRKVDAFMAAAELTEWVICAAEVGRLPKLVGRPEHEPDQRDFAQAMQTANECVAARIAGLAEV